MASVFPSSLFGGYCFAIKSNVMKSIYYFSLLLSCALYAQKPGEAELLKAQTAMNQGNMQVWFDESLKAANKGHADGLYYLGLAYDPEYADQLPVPATKSIEKSFEYYKKSGDAGNFEGAYMTAQMYRLGEGTARNMDMAIAYYKKSYELGHPNGLHAFYQLTPDKKVYIKYLEEGVAKNNFQSARILAEMYITGQDVPVSIPDAMKWLELGEKNNHPGCLYVIGYLHRNGYKKATDGKVTLFNKDANIPKAIEYYEKAAALGNTESMNNLAEMYLIGAEIPQDYNKSYQWFKKSCNAMDGYACFNCAYMLYYLFVEDPEGNIDAYARKSAEYGFDPEVEKDRILFKR
jgi:TPR repeat protein